MRQVVNSLFKRQKRPLWRRCGTGIGREGHRADIAIVRVFKPGGSLAFRAGADDAVHNLDQRPSIS